MGRGGRTCLLRGGGILVFGVGETFWGFLAWDWGHGDGDGAYVQVVVVYLFCFRNGRDDIIEESLSEGIHYGDRIALVQTCSNCIRIPIFVHGSGRRCGGAPNASAQLDPHGET